MFMNNLHLVLKDIGEITLPGLTTAIANANRTLQNNRKTAARNDIYAEAISPNFERQGISVYDKYTTNELKDAYEEYQRIVKLRKNGC